AVECIAAAAAPTCFAAGLHADRSAGGVRDPGPRADAAAGWPVGGLAPGALGRRCGARGAARTVAARRRRRRHRAAGGPSRRRVRAGTLSMVARCRTLRGSFAPAGRIHRPGGAAAAATVAAGALGRRRGTRQAPAAGFAAPGTSRSRGGAAMRRTRGFTLIEILLATALLAAGLALAFATLRAAGATADRGEALAQRNEHMRAVLGF